MNKESVIKFATSAGILLDLSISNATWLNGSCPLAPWTHESGRDGNPSFGISYGENTTKSAFNCYSCKHHGSFSKLISMLARFRETPALNKLAAQIEVAEADVGKQLPPFEQRDYQKHKEAPAAKPVAGGFPLAAYHKDSLAYLKERGVTLYDSICLDIRYDTRAQRVLFPVYDIDKQFAGYTGRLIDPSLVSRKNPKVRDYYGLKKKNLLLSAPRGPISQMFYKHSATRFKGYDKAIIIVEGLFDYARLYSLGFHRVAALLGSVVTPEKVRIIERWGCPIIWMTDPDDAGEACLLGLYDPLTDMHKYTTGALWLLRNSVPQFTVKYPRPLDPGDTKLTRKELFKMLEDAELHTS